MADDIRIVLTGDSQTAQQAIQRTNADLKKMADDSAINLKSLVNSGTVMGIGFRDARQVIGAAAQGIESAMTNMGESASSGIGKTTREISGLVLSAAYLGPVGAAITVAAFAF